MNNTETGKSTHPQGKGHPASLSVGDLFDIVDRRIHTAIKEAVDKAIPSPQEQLHVHEAERGTLCAILLDNSKYEAAELDGLRWEDFHHPAHAAIFQAMQQLHSAHQPIDSVTLTEQLTRNNKLQTAGGHSMLTKLQALLPTTAHSSAHTRLIQDKALLRRLLKVLQEGAQRVLNPKDDARNVIDQTEQAIFSIRREFTSKDIVHVGTPSEQAMQRYKALNDNKTPITGVPSGFSALDQFTRGLQQGALLVIAARPSMGKTAFALNIVSFVATKRNKPVVFFSLEMSTNELTDRLISSDSRVDLSNLHCGDTLKNNYSALKESVDKLKRSPLYIDETSCMSISQLRSKARHMVQRYGAQLIVVDYLQLMNSDTSYDNKATEVGEISRGLKSLARELKVPIIALSQLNRSVESRVDKRPMMSDLRESGAIEQDADVVVLLYREEYYLRDRTPEALQNLAEVIVAKNRNGPTSSFKLRFTRNIAKFDNLA
ncbi:MAG: replicative DNA helicase [Myxococcota bacterium]